MGVLLTNWPGYVEEVQGLQAQVESVLTPLGVAPGWLGLLETQAVGEVQAFATAIARDLIPRLAEFFGTVIDLVLVLILSIYLCLDGARMAQWLKDATPGPRAQARAQVLISWTNGVVGG